MNEKIALIFGNNKYAKEIEKNIKSIYQEVYLLALDSNDDELNFDLSDNWSVLKDRFDMDSCISFCILEDMAENIFLTISLRDTFKDLHIVSLATDKESANKLELAGASRVIPLRQTVANIIVEMLEKPIVTDILHNILYDKSDLQIAQVQVVKNDDISIAKECGLLVLFIVRKDMSKEFIYSSKANHHDIEEGDSFIVVGIAKDIVRFERRISI